MRFGRFLLVGLAALAIASPASAASMAKGSSLLAIQLHRGVADLTGDAGGILISFSKPEVGFQGQYWYFMAEEYAVTVTAGIGYFKETDTADPAVIGASDFTQSISSFQIRVGGDRWAKVSDNLQIFAGPGIQIWNGKFKQEDALSGEAESPTTTRIALSGRMGARIAMGESFGLVGQLGQYWGYATASEGGAETKWLPSGTDGAVGFAFSF